MSDYVKLLLIISLHSQNQTIICLQNNKKFIILLFDNSVSLSETYKITAFSAFDPFTKTICIRKMHLIYSCSTWACSMYNVTDIRRKESMWYQNFTLIKLAFGLILELSSPNLPNSCREVQPRQSCQHSNFFNKIQLRHICPGVTERLLNQAPKTW